MVAEAGDLMSGAGVVFSAGGARWRWSASGVEGNGVPVNTLTQSVLSTQNVNVLVTLSPSSYNPTGDAVAMAFTPQTYPETSPTSGYWTGGTWSTLPGPAYWAQCLVGPANGGTALSLGTYQVWLKITDSPEVPVLQPCLLAITP